MVKNDWKCIKIIKNILFSSFVWVLHVEIWEKWTFLAFLSDSQTLVDTQKLVVPSRFSLNSIVFTSTWPLHEPLVQMMKKVCFWYFEAFLSFSTMQMHVQACVCWSKYTTIRPWVVNFEWQKTWVKNRAAKFEQQNLSNKILHINKQKTLVSVGRAVTCQK